MKMTQQEIDEEIRRMMNEPLAPYPPENSIKGGGQSAEVVELSGYPGGPEKVSFWLTHECAEALKRSVPSGDLMDAISCAVRARASLYRTARKNQDFEPKVIPFKK